MANNHSQQIVQKLWNYCNVLRDDGLSYLDYIEQLTCLLFLKMSFERTLPPWNQLSTIPKGYDWPSLLEKDGDALETHYRHILEKLGKGKGMLGIIFRKTQNKIQDPAKLRRLIADLIDREQWTSLEADVKGDAYEGLLEKNAQDTKEEGRGNILRHVRSFRRLWRLSARNQGRLSVIRPVEREAFYWQRMIISPIIFQSLIKIRNAT
jgi:type I restriction-modification system DNA methylase subunit